MNRFNDANTMLATELPLSQGAITITPQIRPAQERLFPFVKLQALP